MGIVCKRCKKGGLFRYILPSGYCPDCDRLNQVEQESQQKLDAINFELQDREALRSKIAQEAMAQVQAQTDMLQDKIHMLQNEIAEQDILIQKKNKELQMQSTRLQKILDVYSRMDYAVKHYVGTDGTDPSPFESELLGEGFAVLEPVVEMRFHCMENRELRKRFNANKKQIDGVIQRYSERYTTKANIAIYNLAALGMKAELQNILSNVRYDELATSLGQVRQLMSCYLKLATEGDRTIAPTFKNFIGEMEFLFLQTVTIEHEYYVQKERIREEQRALREQMRQEAEERRLLAQKQKQMEREEEKYKNEMKAVQEQLKAEKADDEKYQQLIERLNRLQEQLDATESKKEDIVKLQNGQAGYVYVISNLGSFGDDVFKIGMTRRLEPMERIDELSNASIPFPYDIHCFIFSQNAVDLENNIHHALHKKRVNRVNLRKEFFRLSLDDMEALVYKLEPSAEFNRTMLAEQYHQSLSIEEVPEEDSLPSEIEEDEEEAS